MEDNDPVVYRVRPEAYLWARKPQGVWTGTEFQARRGEDGWRELSRSPDESGNCYPSEAVADVKNALYCVMPLP
jgi:hypothetical protein